MVHTAPKSITKARLPPAAQGAELVALSQAGNWSLLQAAAERVTGQFQWYPLGWRALGMARLRLGEPAAAIEPLRRAARLTPDDARVHNDLGVALRALARKREAVAAYRRALDVNPGFADAHTNLGWALCDLGESQTGLEHCRQAVALAPGAAIAHNNLGICLRELGHLAEAEAAYRRSLELQPKYIDAMLNLGTLLADLHRMDAAKACYREAIRVDPASLNALNALGKLLSRLQADDDEAIACLRRAIALRPDDATAYAELGNVLIRGKQTDAALEMFRRGQALRPFITQVARRELAAFSALFLDTPLAGSTPVDYLTDRVTYDRHSFCLMPGGLDNVALLREKADVVFNMIADPDGGATILAQALDLVDRIARPTVNHPRAVMGTHRDTIAQRLAGFEGCVIPRTLRVSGAALANASSDAALDEFRLPLLVRLAGTHGGDEFEKCLSWEAVGDVVARRPDAAYYLSEYVDYRSADGWFRKYRVIFVDGEILPYHLAIHDDWKVHHYRTDMASHAWMRQEEENFLADMGSVFDAASQDTLRRIAGATGLDYGGIDCGRDPSGRIVVFEANASMLVHDEKDNVFSYKNPYVARIKAAFGALLERRRQQT